MSCHKPYQRKYGEPLPRRDGVHGGSGRITLLALLPLAPLVLLPRTAPAQQWLVTPEIELAAQYVDNPRLQETDETDEINGGLIDVALALRRNTQTSSFVLRPAVAVFRYPNDSEENAEGYFLDLDANNEGQRGSWRLRGNFRQQQVFRGETTPSEIDEIGIEDDVQTSSGRTFVRRQRDLWRIRPGFTMDFTELTSLDVDLSYLDVSYDTEEVGEAIDYYEGRIDAAIVHALTQYNQLEFGVFASRYDPDVLPRQTDSVGALVRYQQSTSDISTFFIEAGAQESETQSALDPDIDVSNTDVLWGIGYERRLEVTTWRFDLGRKVTPSGLGTVVKRNLFRAIMDRQLKPRWSLLLSAVIMNTDSVAEQDVLTTNDRDYAQGRATLAYQMTPSWTVQGRYAFTYQDFDRIPGDAQQNEVRLSLVYRPPIPE